MTQEEPRIAVFTDHIEIIPPRHWDAKQLIEWKDANEEEIKTIKSKLKDKGLNYKKKKKRRPYNKSWSYKN